MKSHLAFALLLGLAGLARADKVFVDKPSDPTPSGVDERTLVQLIRTATSQQGHTLVNAAADAKYILKPGLLRLGNSYVLSLEKRANGEVVSATQLKAREADELDEIAQRVVRAVFAEKAATADVRPSDVTQDEATKGTRRKLNRSGSIFHAGVAFLGGLGTTGPGFYVATGRGWAMGNLTLGIGADLALDPDDTRAWAIFGSVKVDATYYFLDADFSPFVTADFGFGYARHAETRSFNGGMVLGGSAGVGFFRTYDVHARAGLRVQALLNDVLPETPKAFIVFAGIAF